MATKKKNIIKGRTKANKTINLTQNKTSAHVTRYVGDVRADFVRIMKHSNVPALMEFARDPNVVQNYFLNRPLNIALLGDNIKHMDIAFRYAMTHAVSKEIKAALKEKGSCYPGIWLDEMIFSLTATMVNVTMLADAPEKGHFLTVVPSQNVPTTTEQINEMASSMAMAFTEYNPNRLFQLSMVLQNNVLQIIADNVDKAGINALVCTPALPINIRYAREFGRVFGLVLADKGLLEDGATISGDMEAQAKTFIELMEQPLIGHMFGLMTTSGLAGGVINEMLRYSKADVFYDVGDDDEFGDNFITEGHRIRYTLRYEGNTDNNFAIVFNADVMDMFQVAKWSQNAGVVVDKKVYERLGKALYEFFMDMVKYTISIHLVEKDDGTSPEEEEAAGVSPDAESDLEIDDSEQENPEAPAESAVEEE